MWPQKGKIEIFARVHGVCVGCPFKGNAMRRIKGGIKLLESDPGGASSCVVLGQLRRPQEQIVSEQLHDQRRVLVVLVLHAVQVRNCFVEGCACHRACLLRVLEDLVVEDGVVQGQAKLQRVRVA